MKKLVFIVGSLRKGSFNEKLANIVEDILKDRAEITYLNPREVPHYNQDIELPLDASVEEVWRKVKDADGVWIFTPEYNKQVPGALKNLLDWLSRPTEYMNFEVPSVMKGKKTAISGAGGLEKNIHVRESLESLLHFMGVEVVGGVGTGFALPMEAFMTGDWEPESVVHEELKKQAEDFIEKL